MKICIVGACGFKALAETTGGQPVKTRELYYALCKRYGEVSYVDTYRWKDNIIALVRDFFTKVRQADRIVMLPAHNGIRLFSRLLIFLKKKNAKLFYDVIGGWLGEIVKKDKGLLRRLRSIDGIWVETSSMKKSLEEQGLRNIIVLPNFKDVTPVTKDELETIIQGAPYKLCTFSRVVPEKGIEDAIKAVRAVNKEKIVFTLDIYGPVEKSYREHFDQLMKDAPPYIRYKGIANPGDSVTVLKYYYALLFPTHYYTEGIPGSIIDAYYAGVPVVTALWNNSGDVFEEGTTGLGYKMDDKQGLEKCLERVKSDPGLLIGMRRSSLDYSKKYSTEVILDQIEDLMR